MMRLIYIVFLLLLAAPVTAEDRVSGVIAVIIPLNQSADALHLAPSKLQLIYLRKQLYWPDGKRIFPVNLQTEHALRLTFSKAVLSTLPTEQISYWNGLYFNGIRPPYTVNSDEAALRYVVQTPQAIAYVDACKVDARVQAVLWIEDNQITTKAPEGLNCEKNH